MLKFKRRRSQDDLNWLSWFQRIKSHFQGSVSVLKAGLKRIKNWTTRLSRGEQPKGNIEEQLPPLWIGRAPR